MKSSIAVLLITTSMMLTGCNEGESGGPGASLPDSEQSTIGKTDNTFSLDTPMLSIDLTQGEAEAFLIGIKRTDNFNQDVQLRFDDLPMGVTITPQVPLIKHGDMESKMTIAAEPDAALGDFTVKVSGHPSEGDAATSEFTVTIDQLK